MTATAADKKDRFLALVPSAVEWEPGPPSAEVVTKREKRSKADPHDQSPEESPGRGADRLIPMLADVPLFVEDSATGYALIHGRLYKLNSKDQELCEDLCYHYRNATGKTLSKDAASSTIGYMNAKARREGAKIELFNRNAEKDDELFYDLGNGRAVKVSAGSWEIVEGESLLTLFRRHSHQWAQPDPLPGGNAWRFLEFIRLPQESHLLAVVTLITCFICRIHHPAILFIGAQGSGKSVAQSFWKAVIDPSEIMLSLMPRKIEDLPLLLSRNYVTNIDNIVSNMSGDVADLFCAVITGGILETRALHTDSDMVARKVSGVVTFSSITTFSDRADFNERLVRLPLERISEEDRKTDKALWQSFNAALPEILGGVFDVLSRALVIYPGVEESLERLPRMASFATYGVAIAEALGEGKGLQFLANYTASMNQATADLLESNTLMMTIVDRMETGEPLEGTFAEILEELRKTGATSEEARKMLDRDRTFPTAARSLRKALERLRVPLMGTGIEFKILDGEDRPHKSRGKAWVNFYKNIPAVSRSAESLTRQESPEEEYIFDPDQDVPF